MVNLENCNVLVTGGCGFIGSNFIELINKKYDYLNIVNIDKLGIGSNNNPNVYARFEGVAVSFPRMENNLLTDCYLGHPSYYKFYNRYKFVKGDLCDPKLVDDLIDKEQFDYIFHFAAESHVDRSISDPNSFIYNNIISTSNLLNAVNKHSRHTKVVVISSDEVFGHLDKEDPPFTEMSQIAPRSPYSASKASSDMIALAYANTYALDVLVTRCCNNFGPYQHSEKLIPTIIGKYLRNEKIPVYGKGDNIREWIHVDDHNKSILEIAQLESGKTYNIGGGTELSNLELIHKILDIINNGAKFNFNEAIQFVEDRKGHDFRYALSSVNYSRSFEPVPFEDALRETVHHYAKLVNNKAARQ